MEKRGITFSFGKDSHYRGTQLLSARKRKGLHELTVVKWSKICSTSSSRKDAPGRETTTDKFTSKEVLMWMSREEILACCPHLMETTSTQKSEREEETVTCTEDGSLEPAGCAEENDSLHEFAADVANLVSRAKPITQCLCRTPVRASEKSLASIVNIVNILSAYAKIGSLANSFRQCGALDLLLDLLSSHLPNIRKSASDMLRALSTYDSASRAYVFLHLANREEGPGKGDTPTLENRQMLLELFAETSSQDEENGGLATMSLPHVSGLMSDLAIPVLLAFGWDEVETIEYYVLLLQKCLD